ncbi:MAG: Ser-Thr-rich GPI-anchored membrane family protein, partial [Terriglobales bacterium]
MGRGVRAIGLAAVLLLPLLLSGTAFAAGIAVTSPNGGETWQTGTTQTIRWSYTGSLRSTVTLQLLKNGAVNSTIASGVPLGSSGAGFFNWTIPTGQALGTDYK